MTSEDRVRRRNNILTSAAHVVLAAGLAFTSLSDASADDDYRFKQSSYSSGPGSSQPWARRPERRNAYLNAPQNVAIASYINPRADPDAWNRLIAADSNKVRFVVANVLNGPSSAADATWTDVIKRAHDSHKLVLGYVDTGYLGLPGQRTRLGSQATSDWIAQAEQDVDAWYALYPGAIDGIFFDDGYNTCGQDNEFSDLYEGLNQYVKRRHGGAMTVLNPGTIVPACYQYTADVLLTYEGNYAGYVGTNTNPALNYKDLDWVPDDPSKIWHIVYDVSADQDRISQVATLSLQRGAGYLEITDDVLPNPYDSLPAQDYWLKEQQAVSGGRAEISDADPYPSGGRMPDAPALLALNAVDYTSAKITWTASLWATGYVVYLDSKPILNLPDSIVSTTIGGLDPTGRSYQLYVTAQGPSGRETGPSNTVTATTQVLPDGLPIIGQQLNHADTSITYAANFLTPYAFHRVFIGSSDPTANCWVVGYDPANGLPFCARWVIENSNLLVYSAASPGDWDWQLVSTVTPSEGQYTWSWTVNASDILGAVDHIAFQGEGYGPFTSVYIGG